jgi:pimeloyl-ACP methyl ester carboxylesterase
MPVYHTKFGSVETLEWGAEESGERDTLIVLLHAAAAGPGGLSGLAKALVAPDRRIVAPALHLYGRSIVTDAEDWIGAHGQILDWVLDQFPARRRLLFGHSMGGLVALETQRAVDALAVYEPAAIALLRDDDPEDRAERDWDRAIVARLTAAVASGDPEDGVRAFVEAWNNLRWSDLPAPARARLLSQAPNLAREVVLSSERPPRIGPNGQGATILLGGASPRICARIAARLEARLPGSRRITLDGCGHMGPHTEPERVAEALRSAWGLL